MTKEIQKQQVYLVANSHIDPVWQWTSNEGASATLATFKSAVNLLKKYDYIFCHNEALIYQYVEETDPKLFKEIQNLVKEGKWKIMGGWYDQPDCLVPSGESFLRQISLGREYFKEKFNVRPTTALNFDSFGHTRGLVQILSKCGFDSYIFCRPSIDIDPIVHGPFLWEGYDGSKVKALRYEGFNIYCSTLGFAGRDIQKKLEAYPDQSNVIVLWGVGNHGGIQSASDLEQIA
jgi:alpha-mannosidase